MFVQRKIMSKLYGGPVADLHALTRLSSLEEAIQHFKETKELGYTKLIPDLGSCDPDDAFSVVPYEKGFNFLYYLENVAGGPGAFKGFIKAYVEKFGGTTLTSQDFKNFYIEYFTKNNPEVCLDNIDWNSWFYGVGGVLIKNNFDDTLVEQVKKLEEKILANEDYSKDDIKGWIPAQIFVLLDRLLLAKESKVDVRMLVKMDLVLEFSKTQNSEIRFRWQKLGLGANWEKILPQVQMFIGEQGRLKFTRPLYRMLYKSNVGRKLAETWFKGNDHKYHPICRKMVKKDLENLKSKSNITKFLGITSRGAYLLIGSFAVVSLAYFIFKYRKNQRADLN